MRRDQYGAGFVLTVAALAWSMPACGSGAFGESGACKDRKEAIRDQVNKAQNLPPEYQGEPCGDATQEPFPYYAYACSSCADECAGECVLGE